MTSAVMTNTRIILFNVLLDLSPIASGCAFLFYHFAERLREMGLKTRWLSILNRFLDNNSFIFSQLLEYYNFLRFIVSHFTTPINNKNNVTAPKFFSNSIYVVFVVYHYRNNARTKAQYVTLRCF